MLKMPFTTAMSRLVTLDVVQLDSLADKFARNSTNLVFVKGNSSRVKRYCVDIISKFSSAYLLDPSRILPKAVFYQGGIVT